VVDARALREMIAEDRRRDFKSLAVVAMVRKRSRVEDQHDKQRDRGANQRERRRVFHANEIARSHGSADRFGQHAYHQRDLRNVWQLIQVTAGEVAA